jgi:hypothetical protein
MRRGTGLSRMWLVALLVALGIALGVAALAAFAASSGDNATSSGDRVKVIIAGTNDALEEQVDGGITGEGTFRATGAITDRGTARGYRGLSTLDPKVILLRFVTKGKKGAITYAVTIDTKPRPVISRWKIQFRDEGVQRATGRRHGDRERHVDRQHPEGSRVALKRI